MLIRLLAQGHPVNTVNTDTKWICNGASITGIWVAPRINVTNTFA